MADGIWDETVLFGGDKGLGQLGSRVTRGRLLHGNCGKTATARFVNDWRMMEAIA